MIPQLPNPTVDFNAIIITGLLEVDPHLGNLFLNTILQILNLRGNVTAVFLAALPCITPDRSNPFLHITIQ